MNTPGPILRLMRSPQLQPIRWMLTVHRFLIRLYPRSFLDLFEDELSGVFTDLLREAQLRGWRAVWACFFREVLDLVPNLLREYVSNDFFDRMVERMLVHRQHSRWRRAGALGFALGFALMELTNQVGHLFPSTPGVAFPGTAAHISVLTSPDGSLEITPFHGIGLVMLLACGLVAGLILNRAEKPIALMRLPLVTAASLGGAYALLYGVNYAVWRTQFTASWGYGLLNVMNPILFGGLAALVLGAFLNQPKADQQTTGHYLGRVFVMGAGGTFLGGLAAFIVVFALAMIDWIERSIEQFVYRLPAIPDKGLISGFFLYPIIMAVVFSTVLGWFYGAHVGEKIGAQRGAPVAVTEDTAGSGWAARVVIAVLVVIVVLSLLLLAINTPRR